MINARSVSAKLLPSIRGSVFISDISPNCVFSHVNIVTSLKKDFGVVFRCRLHGDHRMLLKGKADLKCLENI